MTLAEFRKRGFLAEISGLFRREDSARHCLTTFGYPPRRLPEFDSAEMFWTTVAQEIEGGILPEDDLESLVQHAADQYPGNRLLGPYAVSQRSEEALQAADSYGAGFTPHRSVPSHKKRLQVFISSTYADLRAERQAAVEAILTAGHIPAGMELFTAGDETQMEVIKRWIDESDVFMLILGLRYGSIEPTTGKSYTHIEYDYAVANEKPVFATVLADEAVDERVRRMGPSVMENQDPKALREFRKQVCGRMVRFWTDLKDIKLTVHETMVGFARREDLRGWVRAPDDIDAGTLAASVSQSRPRLTGARGAPTAEKPLDLFTLLVSRSYRLFFRPADADGSKVIIFKADSIVSEGRNNNENSWRLGDGKLELVQLDGKVHSRFFYDAENDRFEHTGDADTSSSNTDQYIVPETP